MDRLRIGVDGYNLAMPRGTGIATYGHVLAATLRSMGHGVEGVFGIAADGEGAMREVSFLDRLMRAEASPPRLTGWRWIREHFGTAAAGARAVEVPETGLVDRRGIADRLPAFDRLVTSPHLFARAHTVFRHTGRFTELRVDSPPDIMHWTYPLPVTLAGARNVYTLHDLVPLKLPYATLDNKGFYDRLARACAGRAAHVCTVSEASRADIVALLGVAPDKVTNTYQAAPAADAASAGGPEDDARAVEGLLGLGHRGYFLFYGAIEPKKNVGRLIEAYLSVATAAPLVIVGARAWASDDALRLIDASRRGGAADRIVAIDYLPRSLLLRLVRGARALVFPSLDEGFGLPVLEAMQLGTPVIAADAGALPEVAGDAALLVDPWSTTAIAAAIRRIDDDAPLRDALAARGPVQAAKFGPAAYADRLAALYAKVMAAAPSGSS